MNKVYTLAYSIHNLASKAANNLSFLEDCDTSGLFLDVERLLNESKLFDVRQEVVDTIILKAASL